MLKIVSDTINQKIPNLELAYSATIANFPPTGEQSLNGIQQALDATKQFGGLPGIDTMTAEELYDPDLQQEAAAALGLK